MLFNEAIATHDREEKDTERENNDTKQEGNTIRKR
jgi:hypothetical protein